MIKGTAVPVLEGTNIMFTIKRPQIDKEKRFTLLAVGFSAFLLIAGTFEFIPAWILRDAADDLHLWHIAELSALAALLLGGVMLALIRRPQEKLLLAQFFLLSLIILAIGFIPFDIDALVLGINIYIPVLGLGNLPLNTVGFAFLLLAGVFALAYPDRRALLSFKLKGRISIALLLLTIVFAVFLDPVINKEVYYQIIGIGSNDAHALELHWIGSALLMVLLIVAGLMASTKRPGWKILGFIAGEVYIFLGVITMIVPNYAGSWGEASGLFAIFGGVLYILIVLAEAEGTSKSVSTPESEPVSASEAVPGGEAEAPAVPEGSFSPKAGSPDGTQQLVGSEMYETKPAGMA
jgi:hypothetical protein